jgi:hypothetical protein
VHFIRFVTIGIPMILLSAIFLAVTRMFFLAVMPIFFLNAISTCNWFELK